MHWLSWEKPAIGRYKSFSFSLNIVGIEILGFLLYVCDDEITEAFGLHTTLKWTLDLQLYNLDFALDFKNVVDSFGCIISAYRQMFHNSFKNSHVEFNMRQINGVARELIRLVLYNVWWWYTFMYLVPYNAGPT